MHWRTVAALLITPAIAAAIPTISFALDPALLRIGPREWIQVGAWVAFALVFELAVLLPTAFALRKARFFRTFLFVVGATVWAGLSLAWFVIVFRQPFAQAFVPALRVGLAGVVVCATFAVFWRRPQPVRSEPAGPADA